MTPPNSMSPAFKSGSVTCRAINAPRAEGRSGPADGVEVVGEPVDGFSRWVARCGRSGGVLSRVLGFSGTGRFLNLRAAQFAKAGVSGLGRRQALATGREQAAISCSVLAASLEVPRSLHHKSGTNRLATD